MPASINGRRGIGKLVASRVNDQTCFTQIFAESPLKLLTPRNPAPTAWAVSSTLGGGLLEADSIELHVALDASTHCLLTTQASTKVFRAPNRQPSRQTMNVAVAPSADFITLPDPVTCFAGSRYEQRQNFDLAPEASLLMLEWITSGRLARGETWAFDSYRSRTQIRIADKLVLLDSLSLDPADGPVAGAFRTGGYHGFATVILIGPAFTGAAQTILNEVAALPVRIDADRIISASPLVDGTIIRLASRSTDVMYETIRHHLRFLPDRLGYDPWSRKW